MSTTRATFILFLHIRVSTVIIMHISASATYKRSNRNKRSNNVGISKSLQAHYCYLVISCPYCVCALASAKLYLRRETYNHQRQHQ